MAGVSSVAGQMCPGLQTLTQTLAGTPVCDTLMPPSVLVTCRLTHQIQTWLPLPSRLGSRMCHRAGVDYTHPDLGGCLGTGCKVAYGYNFIENNGDPQDACIGAHRRCCSDPRLALLLLP